MKYERSKTSVFSTFKYDFPSGLVVFLVALPLCLGIALASGAPFFSGLISGIIGGIVIGMISGSPLSVSGPAAGLAALVLGAISIIGDYRLFLCSVLVAGILQIILGLAKLGTISNYLPSSVIKGMLTSIGILIFVKQIPHAFGYNKNEQGNTELLLFGMESMPGLMSYLNHIEWGVLLLCVLSLVIMIFWEKPYIKKRVKFIPGALVSVIIAIIVNEIWISTGSSLAVQPEYLVQLKEPKSLNEFISFFMFPDFSGLFNGTVLMYGVAIAIIASLESLLSIEAIDAIDPKRRVTNTNHELVAQGIGNTVAGLIGGLPLTSVIVRSSANVNAGAKSKMSTVMHGFMLLISVIFIPFLLNKIPLSALAAILLLVGYKLAKPSFFKEMLQNGKYQFLPFIVTVFVILGIDMFNIYPPLSGKGLLIGVMAGIITATGAILHGNLKNSYYFHKEKHQEGDLIRVHLSEEVSFLNKAAIRETLDHIPENSSVVIDASQTRYIDFDVLEFIKEFRDIKAPIKNIRLELCGFKEVYKIENEFNVQSAH